MPAKTLSKCPACGYPINAEYEGQAEVCAYCGEKLIAQEEEGGVRIPATLFVGIVAFFAGVLIGPAVVASTTEGRKWLEEQARGAIRR